METCSYRQSESSYGSQRGNTLLQCTNLYDDFENHMIDVNAAVLRISSELLNMHNELLDLKRRNYELRCELSNLECQNTTQDSKVTNDENNIETIGDPNNGERAYEYSADEYYQPSVMVEVVRLSKPEWIYDQTLYSSVRLVQWSQNIFYKYRNRREKVSKLKRARKCNRQKQWNRHTKSYAAEYLKSFQNA